MSDTPSRRERAIELLGLISDARKQLRGWEVELDGLLPGDHATKPRTSQRKPKAESEPKASVTTSDAGAAGSGKGQLTNILRTALKSMPPEFSAREWMAAAGIPEDRTGSAFAAISRMLLKSKEIVKSPTRGKYRRATHGSHQAVATKPAAATKASATIRERILALLIAEPLTTFDAPTIGKRFGVSDKMGLNSIRGALSRMSRDGEIQKVGRGDYRTSGAMTEFKVVDMVPRGEVKSR